jgi:hypothetical protein
LFFPFDAYFVLFFIESKTRDCARRDLVTYSDRTSEDESKWFKFDIMDNSITFEYIERSFENAHSVHAGSSSSCMTLLSFFLLLHVASFLAGN